MKAARGKRKIVEKRHPVEQITNATLSLATSA